MSDSAGEHPQHGSGGEESKPNDSQKAIRQNLNSFLNPGMPLPPASKPTNPKGALQLHMAQMELANRMRLQQQQQQQERKEGNQVPNSVPMHRSPPPGGFGSAQGMFHMKAGNFGQKKPAASKPSPYQQIFANASKSPQELAKEQAEAEAKRANEVIDVPSDAEVKQNQKPKRSSRAKKFRNPSL